MKRLSVVPQSQKTIGYSPPELEQILNLLAPSNFLIVNKTLLINLGAIKALFLSYLIDRWKYFIEKKMVEDGGAFYITNEQFKNEIGLSEWNIREAKKELITAGIIRTEFRGTPPKDYFLIDTEKLMGLFSQHRGFHGDETAQHRGIHGDVVVESTGITLYKNTKVNKTKASPAEEPFEQFWKAYPNKWDKGKTKTAWEKIFKRKISERPQLYEILEALEAQKKSERWQDKNYIPHPTTWLNQSRWLDDPKEMKVPKRLTPSRAAILPATRPDKYDC